ncbi:hypothetical protein CMO83_02425 [Candidatus Woesearchaeota archaeon]|jgi:cellulose biosynthesis protein BcsQ|nr:hypothetical protein [Candidatus Woesearchaeota archaeon]MDP6648285.1 hypothetical protein [Candidatus Woesearchaeota archaeon]|tara:strand:+ start:37947 stop:38531 length:585 start_codon:yes stop_codon:yes gene_type:complete
MVETEKQGEKSHIRCKTIIEVLGKPKEHVENSLKEYTDHIRKDSDLAILNEHYSDIKEQGKLWSKFVELDLVIKGTKKLISFCFEYMPSSLEVEKPDELSISKQEISNFLNDLQARLHNVDMIVKKSKSENDFLRSNMNAILHNSILICLKVSKLSLEQLSQVTGVDKKELEIFVNNLIKEKKIKKEKDIYALV